MEKSEASGMFGRWCTWVSVEPPPWGFPEALDERLYAAYTQRQRQRAVPRMLALAALFHLFVGLVPGHPAYFGLICATVGLIINIILLILYLKVKPLRNSLSHLVWFIVWIDLIFNVSYRREHSYNELLGWAVVMQYMTLASLPFHHLTLAIYSITSTIGYLVIQYIVATLAAPQLPDDFGFQETVNLVMFICASVLGGVSYTVTEKQQRASFQETKQSLKDKLTIEQQSKEQERLLLSVLPEHVAVQMRQDLGLIDTQFKKIYMSRHENVSILYADIVGFTAISSTYSAQDLVAILNELFARFDRLAEKYQQLRIKILGDCYYCISGAPVERPDHAVLCVHMGLSMVKAIKYVQQSTSSPVDMRVGIHTGAVLAGVLGQRQWQFDVYSRDVELANKMESSGMAGRVHISEATLGFLRGEFEVEPAFGERREEMLRQANVRTYFIVRVLKPYVGANGDANWEADLRDDDDEDSVLSPQDEQFSEDAKITEMLEEELVNRDDDKELAEDTTLCLQFRRASAEAAWRRRGGSGADAGAGAAPLLLVAPQLLLLTFAAPPSAPLLAAAGGLVLELLLVNLAYYTLIRCHQNQKKEVSPYWKIGCIVFNMTMFIAANIVPLILCEYYEDAHGGAQRCQHPSYYYHVCAGALCGASLAGGAGAASGAARGALLLLAAAAHALPRALYHPASAPARSPAAAFDTIYGERNIVMLLLIAVALIIFNRYTERGERALALRGRRTAAQAAQAGELRRRNLALVHNVLPPHVAEHFMGARHRHTHLYSQSYSEVAVLFAAMPNFTEFYSEESVNNQGLECLRFLNEVISDFDLLLEDPKFSKDIIKIKTIGSSYMAASGLNPVRQMQPGDGVLVRWAHLARLVEFALELQRVLAAINEQSFNHFVLRLGLNHGPITAGVIGARKPHYDIWGNTVNVASRMESTGKAGCIQVTEETCQILQQFGYYFEQRGLVAVKGKGQLMTYYLLGKRDTPDLALSTSMEDTHAPSTCEDPADDNVTQALLGGAGAAPTAAAGKHHRNGGDVALLPA